MAKVQIIGGSFQDSEGNPLANGYLLLELNSDEQVISSAGQVCSGITIKIPLDANGDIQGTTTGNPVYVWPNDLLTPANSCYTVTVYSATGQLSWGPEFQQVLSTPSPYNISAWIPSGDGCGCGSGSNNPCPDGVLFETNGVPNIAQCTFDLVDGINTTVVADTSTTRIDAVEQYQHNEAPVGEEPILDFQDSSTVVFTVTDHPVDSRVIVSAAAAAPATLPLPPPFPIPPGQAVAFAFPTVVQYGDESLGHSSTNGSAYATLQSAYLNMTASCGLCNSRWMALWSGWVMPTLPNDAVIQGMYLTYIAQNSGVFNAEVHLQSFNSNTSSTTATNFPGSNTQWQGEYYSNTSIGNSSSILPFTTARAELTQSLALSFNQNLTVYAVAIAIYYTTANPPNISGNPFIIPLVTPSYVSPPYVSLNDAAGVGWSFGFNYRANASVTLTGNRTLTVSNIPDGGEGNLVVTQDGTGSRTLTVASGKVAGGGGGVINLSSTAGSISIVRVRNQGGNLLFDSQINYT